MPWIDVKLYDTRVTEESVPRIIASLPLSHPTAARPPAPGACRILLGFRAWTR